MSLATTTIKWWGGAGVALIVIGVLLVQNSNYLSQSLGILAIVFGAVAAFLGLFFGFMAGYTKAISKAASKERSESRKKK